MHRWVLLKNSIIHTPSLTTSCTAPTDTLDAFHTDSLDDGDGPDEEVCLEEESDSFMFPDAGKFVDTPSAAVNTSEAQWLDSLLETLGDDEDDDFSADSDTHILPVDDDDDQLLSPLVSPMSSSENLTTQAYTSPVLVPYSYPYPLPYPPFHPPLIHTYDFHSTLDSTLLSPSNSPPYDHPLPYYDLDDVENLSVPDAIEDTSDDESDAPDTPSTGQSRSSIALDPASIPLPADRSRLRHPIPHVYIDADDSYFYPFELDPLPFPADHHHQQQPQHHTSYNSYQEC